MLPVKKYATLMVSKEGVRTTIFEHSEFISFTDKMDALFASWKNETATFLKSLNTGNHPKDVVFKISENLLEQYTDKPLIDKYDIYQHLMDYWNEIMQDDCYIISADGWKADISIIKDNKGKEKGWTCDLIPKELLRT